MGIYGCAPNGHVSCRTLCRNSVEGRPSGRLSRTSSTAGAGVRLPTSAPGLIITLVNDGASSVQVFGNTTDSATIDGIGTATGVAMAAAKRGQFICTTAGAWASTAGAKSS